MSVCSLAIIVYNCSQFTVSAICLQESDAGARTAMSQATAYLLPRLLGATNIPLLVTEDDVVFAPNVGSRLDVAMHLANNMASGDPWMLNLYQPPREAADTKEITSKATWQQERHPSQTVKHHRYREGMKLCLHFSTHD